MADERVPMVNHVLPLRPGVRAVLVLPETLTAEDAKRVTEFVAALALPEEADRG